MRGRSIELREVELADAEFILRLRTDPVLARHLNTTPRDLAAQQSWLQRYEQATDQAYFVIAANGADVGLVRLYGAVGRRFSWGSWILGPAAPKAAAIESALLVYEYAFRELGFGAAYFDVRKENTKVWRFHERFGATRVREDAADYHYELSADDYGRIRQRYLRYLPSRLEIQFR